MAATAFSRPRFGGRLRKAIGKAGIRQASVAKELGLDPSRISDWVHGREAPKLEQLPTLAHLLGVDLHWLITGHPAPTGAADALVDAALRAAPALQTLAERAGALADISESSSDH
jgi:transcriptional regulator with XRE-family HTH domain